MNRAPYQCRKTAGSVAACAVSLTAALVCFAPSASAQTSIGSAAVIRNDVQGVRGSATRALATGGSVFNDDQVRTGNDSLAQLVFLDRTTLTVAAQSQAVLKDVYRPSRGYRQLIMNTVRGSFRFVSGAESPHHYEVQFPQGYLTVRGTTVDLNASSTRTVITLVEGDIIVVANATGARRELNRPGETVIVHSDGRIEGPMTREAAIDRLGLASSTFAALPIISNTAGLAIGNPSLYPASDWSGSYVGVNIGVAWGHSTVAPILVFPGFTDFTGTLVTPAQAATMPPATGHAASIIGGGQAGYNWQAGGVVFGVEADIDGTGLHEKSSLTLSRTTASGTQTVTANFSANIDWIATARGRLGYAWDRVMLYATGGVAAAGTTLNTAYSIVEGPQPVGAPVPGTASSSHTIGGWTVGGGGQWAINDLWSFGLEYRHDDFGHHGYSIGSAAQTPFTPPGSANVHFTVDQVTARLNYRFH